MKKSAAKKKPGLPILLGIEVVTARGRVLVWGGMRARVWNSAVWQMSRTWTRLTRRSGSATAVRCQWVGTGIAWETRIGAVKLRRGTPFTMYWRDRPIGTIAPSWRG